MDYHAFPSYSPNEATIDRMVNMIIGLEIDSFFDIHDSSGTTWMVYTLGETKETSKVPPAYEMHIKRIYFRLFTLAVTLKHWDDLKDTVEDLTKLMTTKQWITLAQHLQHFYNMLRKLNKDIPHSRDGWDKWRSPTFDRFLVTEALVRRHEPIYVYTYRANRGEKDPNISTSKVDDMDWRAYEQFVGPILDARSDSLPTLHMRKFENARQLAPELLRVYDNKGRIKIVDPYTYLWEGVGLPSKDPFDEYATDPASEENRETGKETGVDMDI